MNSSGEVSDIGTPLAIPALAKKTSSRPSSSIDRLHSAAMVASSAASPWTTVT